MKTDVVGKHTLETMSAASWYNDWVYSFIKPILGDNTLEIGAGVGNTTRLLTKDTKVTAIDFNRQYLKQLKRIGSVNSGFGDIEKGNYFFKDKKFDTIVCQNVLEHIKDHEQALKNIRNLLNSGGKLFLLVPAHEILYSKFDKQLGHFRRYNKLQLNKLLKKTGFRNSKIFYFNWFGAIGWFVFLRLTGWKKMPGDKVGIFDRLGKLFLWPEKFVKPPFGLSVVAICQK